MKGDIVIFMPQGSSEVLNKMLKLIRRCQPSWPGTLTKLWLCFLLVRIGEGVLATERSWEKKATHFSFFCSSLSPATLIRANAQTTFQWGGLSMNQFRFPRRKSGKPLDVSHVTILPWIAREKNEPRIRTCQPHPITHHVENCGQDCAWWTQMPQAEWSCTETCQSDSVHLSMSCSDLSTSL